MILWHGIFYFWLMLLWHDIFYFSYFCIAHTLFLENLERYSQHGVFSYGWMNLCCVTLSVRVSIFILVGVREFWSWEHEISLNIDLRVWQNSTQCKWLCVWFFKRSMHMALVGIILSFEEHAILK
jgi:hypothetical protein